MEEEIVKRKAGRPRKNIVENVTVNPDTQTGMEASVETIVAEPAPEPVVEKRFMPYFGPDTLPDPLPGKTYGPARFFVNNNIELICIRKKRIVAKKVLEEKQLIDGKEIIIEKEIRAEGFVVSRELFLNLNSKTSKKSGITAELKKCGIPGIL